MKSCLILSASIALNLAAAALAADGLKMEPLAPPSKPSGKTLFTKLNPEETGLTVLNRMNVEHPMNYLYHSGMTTGGVVAAPIHGRRSPNGPAHSGSRRLIAPWPPAPETAATPAA